MILAELANSNHSSTLGVATLGESIVFSSAACVLVEVQVSTTPYSYFNVCTPPCHGVAMIAESNLKYPEVFRIHGSTIISMVLLINQLKSWLQLANQLSDLPLLCQLPNLQYIGRGA